MLPRQSGSLTGGCERGRGGRPQWSRSSPASRPKSRSAWEIAAGALSLGVWVLMPKCPVCLAAHVALWTGLGLSFPEATYARWSLLSMSGALLVYLVVKRRARAFAGE